MDNFNELNACDLHSQLHQLCHTNDNFNYENQNIDDIIYQTFAYTTPPTIAELTGMRFGHGVTFAVTEDGDCERLIVRPSPRTMLIADDQSIDLSNPMTKAFIQKSGIYIHSFIHNGALRFKTTELQESDTVLDVESYLRFNKPLQKEITEVTQLGYTVELIYSPIGAVGNNTTAAELHCIYIAHTVKDNLNLYYLRGGLDARYPAISRIWIPEIALPKTIDQIKNMNIIGVVVRQPDGAAYKIFTNSHNKYKEVVSKMADFDLMFKYAMYNKLDQITEELYEIEDETLLERVMMIEQFAQEVYTSVVSRVELIAHHYDNLIESQDFVTYCIEISKEVPAYMMSLVMDKYNGIVPDYRKYCVHNWKNWTINPYMTIQ